VEIEVEGSAAGWLTHLPDGVDFAASGRIITGNVADGDRIPDLVASLVAAGARIRRVSPSERTLEEVYLSLVGPEGVE
jgi:ABC-2 type transport system ATP-binding protein